MTARITGYITRAGAGLVAPKYVTELNGRRMEGVAVHHGASANPTTHADCLPMWRGYQRMHLAGTRGFQSDIAYNMGVCPHGYVLEGRTFLNQGGANGTSTSNRTYFSVCVIGTGDAVYGTAVTDALEWVIATARSKHNAGDRVRAHRDFFATSCPGTKLTAWVRAADRRSMDAAPVIPWTPGGTVDTYPKLRRGDRGDAVKFLQAVFGLDADGVFGPDTEATVKAYQARKGLDADGVVGPKTWAAIIAGEPASEPEPTPAPDPLANILTEISATRAAVSALTHRLEQKGMI